MTDTTPANEAAERLLRWMREHPTRTNPATRRHRSRTMTSAYAMDPPSDRVDAWSAGDRVTHKRTGDPGTVQAAQRCGMDILLAVRWEGHGDAPDVVSRADVKDGPAVPAGTEHAARPVQVSLFDAPGGA